ncbi:hypothetical protein JYB87_09850 [Shewanella avicenniae]|uniref:Uncharacterized protein n=1 Tax=Shewanella avicenniae TaxID=2814294 RepID=A0ABX7QN06_9GAMM|nr:hypothetical protein [Shewanella avicenniae]QSX32093.1 hypothetical protein JYB87_09850 [Shewanella avicenniae]
MLRWILLKVQHINGILAPHIKATFSFFSAVLKPRDGSISIRHTLAGVTPADFIPKFTHKKDALLCR